MPQIKYNEVARMVDCARVYRTEMSPIPVPDGSGRVELGLKFFSTGDSYRFMAAAALVLCGVLNNDGDSSASDARAMSFANQAVASRTDHYLILHFPGWELIDS